MRELPYHISSKLKQKMQTISNDANPNMEITIARSKSTVQDSTYWTVETIRETTGLGDVSVAGRRFVAKGRPNRIYGIHVHNGEVKTLIREYPDTFKLKWVEQFSVGNGTSVAIAFNGDWARHRNLWRLITDENPWLFWVDNNKILWRQHWDDTSTKEQIDTGVIKVKAMRAWKNVNFIDKDQGIVVAYIKTNGTVWYRNYCQQDEINYVWESAKQITQFTNTAVNLNLFLTNDYRMGFIIEDTMKKIHWLITNRNWAGMAINNDKIKATIHNTSVVLTPINYHILKHSDERIIANPITFSELLYTMPDNTVIWIRNEEATVSSYNELGEVITVVSWGYQIRFRLAHNITAYDTSDFELVDSNGKKFSCTNIQKGQGREYILQFLNFNNAVGMLNLRFKGTGTTRGEAGQIVDSFNEVFIPQNLVPYFIPLPMVETIWIE